MPADVVSLFPALVGINRLRVAVAVGIGIFVLLVILVRGAAFLLFLVRRSALRVCKRFVDKVVKAEAPVILTDRA